MWKKKLEIWLDRFMELVRQDRRKTVIVGLAAFVMVAVSCHFLLRGPAPAPGGVFQSVSSDNPANDANGLAPLGSSEALGQWLKEPKQPSQRNVFALNLEDYPTDSSATPTAISPESNDQKDQSLWDDVAKSLSAQADHKREREFWLKNLQRAAARLSFQKVFPGPPPKAEVNGELIEEGSFVASFRVLRIEPDRITVEKDGITLDVPVH
jgi:hypothetical protein